MNAACHYPGGESDGFTGKGVVTGGKSALQASSGKGFSKHYPQQSLARLCALQPGDSGLCARRTVQLALHCFKDDKYQLVVTKGKYRKISN